MSSHTHAGRPRWRVNICQNVRLLRIGLVFLLGLSACASPTSVDNTAAAIDDAALAPDTPPQTMASPPVAEEDARAESDAMQALDRCPPFTVNTQTGQLQPAQIDEASGLAASWKHEGLFWTHNDSGDNARVFLIRPDGALVAKIQLVGVPEAIDYEDIALAPCAPDSPESCVYIADTGDNLRAREAVAIFRFPEPDLPDGHLRASDEEQTSITLEIDAIDATWFTYADGARDVEALLVHPHSAAIYVVEKSETSQAPVFRVPRESASFDAPTQATQIATLELEGRSSLFAMITAGDIAPNGREFTVRTYLESFSYCAPEADSRENAEDNFEDVFMVSPTRALLPALPQAEALAYDRSGDAIWLTSEGINAPIIRVNRAE